MIRRSSASSRVLSRIALGTLSIGALAAPAARAQSTAPSARCTSQPVPAQDACQKAVDLFQYLAPQLGALVAGGNTEPGQGGTLGGLGRFGLSVRANLLRAPLPQFDRLDIAAGPAQPSNIRVDSKFIGFPVVDASIGLFRGLPLGIATVGGIDLLLNGTFVPNVGQDELAVRTTGGSFKIGYGARLGLLQESLLLPGVSVSVLRRETPHTRVVATAGDDSVDVSGLRVRTDSWRLTASKRIVVASIAAGIGQDRYDSRATVSGVANEAIGVVGGAVTPVALSQQLTRTNYFANLTLLAIPFVRVVGEVGRTSGGSLAPTYNSFDGRRPDAAYTYGSVGVRIGL